MPVPSWHLDLFGPPTLRGPSGDPLRPERKTLALLAYLALEGAERHGLAALAEQARARRQPTARA